MSDTTEQTAPENTETPTNVPAWQTHFRDGKPKAEVIKHVDGSETVRTDH